MKEVNQLHSYFVSGEVEFILTLHPFVSLALRLSELSLTLIVPLLSLPNPNPFFKDVVLVGGGVMDGFVLFTISFLDGVSALHISDTVSMCLMVELRHGRSLLYRRLQVVVASLSPKINPPSTQLPLDRRSKDRGGCW